MIELSNSIDRRTMTLNENLSSDLKFKEIIESSFRDKQFCSCHLSENQESALMESSVSSRDYEIVLAHDTGQAHVHQDVLIIDSVAVAGIIKVFTDNPLPGGGVYRNECYLPFINTTLEPLKSNIQPNDESRLNSFKKTCFNDLEIAYDLKQRLDMISENL